MNKIQIALLILIFTSPIIKAQRFSKVFGIVGKDDIELESYSKDETAEAVVLFDKGKSYFVEANGTFEVVFEKTTRIKIFTEAGIHWAEVEIPFYQEGGIYEKVHDIEAYSYNWENGRIIKTPLNLANMFTEKINNSWNVKKFAIPEAKAGSIIEYKYKINSQYHFNLHDWEFQWKIPVVYSEYEVKMIPFYEYTWLLQGANKFDSTYSHEDRGLSRQFAGIAFQDMVHLYVMKDVPAFNSEEFITSIEDYILKIDFQLSKFTNQYGESRNVITTWEEMKKELIKEKDFGGYIDKSEKMAPKLIDIESLTGKTRMDKFNYILNYVKSNYNWNTYNGKYASKLPGKFVEEKIGNCADINLFTIGLLKAAGIPTYPILLSTRNNGKVNKDYPFSNQFNYVLIMVIIDNNVILTDATDVYNLNYRIPERCINDKGLIIKEGEANWQGLESLFPSEIKNECEIEFNDDMEIKASLKKSYTEYDAAAYRKNYGDKIDDIKTKIDSKDYLIIDSTLEIQNLKEIEKPYILSYKATYTADNLNDKIYVDPFLGEVISDNPLKQKERYYPVDFTYPFKRTFKSTLVIPNGYQLDYLPNGKVVSNKLFTMNYSVISDGNKVYVSFDYYFKKSIYPSPEYQSIKLYYSEIVKFGDEKIVFSKKPIAEESN